MPVTLSPDDFCSLGSGGTHAVTGAQLLMCHGISLVNRALQDSSSSLSWTETTSYISMPNLLPSSESLGNAGSDAHDQQCPGHAALQVSHPAEIMITGIVISVPASSRVPQAQ